MSTHYKPWIAFIYLSKFLFEKSNQYDSFVSFSWIWLSLSHLFIETVKIQWHCWDTNLSDWNSIIRKWQSEQNPTIAEVLVISFESSEKAIPIIYTLYSLLVAVERRDKKTHISLPVATLSRIGHYYHQRKERNNWEKLNILSINIVAIAFLNAK